MQSYLIQKEIAEQQVKLARGAYWPTLSIEGIYSKLDEDPSSPFFNDESIYGVISLTFPFFEGGSIVTPVKRFRSSLKVCPGGRGQQQAHPHHHEKAHARFAYAPSFTHTTPSSLSPHHTQPPSPD